MKVGRASESDLQSILTEGGRRGEIYRGLTEIRDTYAPQVGEAISSNSTPGLWLQPR